MTREVIIDIENPKDNDLISRDAVLDLVADYDLSMGQVVKGIHALPSVTLQPCEDAISRQAVIEQINCWIGSVEYKYTNATYYLTKRMQDLPPVTPQPNKWIPVSERLPEVGSEVLVCYDFKKHRSVYIADFYGDGKFHGLDDEYLTTEGRKYRKAIAWMPLPTPPNQSEIPTVAEGSDKE